MNKRGWFLIGLGICLILAAVVLSVRNVLAESHAGREASHVLAQLAAMLPETTQASSDLTSNSLPASSIPEPLPEETVKIPDYLLNPDMDMPAVSIDGLAFIGILSIPSIHLEQPVLQQWDDQAVKKAPCCYAGSAYRNDMVVAGHNYRNAFGKLFDLQIGDGVTFTDTDGNLFRYRVAELETLPASAVEEMTESTWDFTLFTCTFGGRSRLAVRCESTP